MRIYDEEEIKELNAKNWQIKALELNPNYVYWGNYEDYMSSPNSGWGSPSELDSVKELWELDELNECVNFYFDLIRKNGECKICESTGYNEETQKISNEYYSFDDKSKEWCHNLTADEIKYLMKSRELTKEEAIKRSKEIGIDGCDAIDRFGLIETRAKRLGVHSYCEKCAGKGYIYIEDKATLNLQLWILHPRKGASRGVYIKNIKSKEELQICINYLKEAKDRNNERFKLLK